MQSTVGVRAVKPVSGLIGETLAELERDLPADGVKIGMLGDAAGVRSVAEYLRATHRVGRPVVLDPVLVSSSGRALLTPEGVEALRAELLPLVGWVTPNLAELAVLAGVQGCEAGLDVLAGEFPGLNVVATGGDTEGAAVDLLRLAGEETVRMEGARVETTSTHGTGCAYSSALLARLMLGDAAEDAARGAKAYVAKAMRRAPGVGHGRGPLDLLWPMRVR